ncbi:MAG: hypothetical protein EBZ51_09575 [Synechococcaceae bacterium WB9_2_112]|nr:hypothetical protein [Synechococcaceae bacterium WB9_2_112]
MAAPQAYEQPTINKAWEVFLVHVPTILLIWIVTAVLAGLGAALTWVIVLIGVGMAGGGLAGETAVTAASALGQLVQVPFSILSSLVGVLFVAVPALHYARGETITIQAAFAELLRRPWRYLLAGMVFSLVMTIGFVLCIVPGLVVALVMPIYVNRIFLTDQSIPDAFAASFQAVYRSANGPDFLGIEILAWVLVVVVSVCTCGLGALLAVPVSSFYLQNLAYHKGLVS